MSITITGDYSEIEKEFDRLESQPNYKTRVLLEAVLTEAYVGSQEIVHVDTGSLKSSGRISSSVDKMEHNWEGTLEYGGPSGSVNNPVTYAIYEKARGAEHDFIKNTQMLHSMWVAAIKGGLAK